MISTSPEYKQAVDSHYQDWQVSATIDYTDYNLDNSIAPVVNYSDRLSDDAQLADGIEVTTYDFFAGWEHFEWGQHFRSESSTVNEKGALSEQLSDTNGDFVQLGCLIAGYTVPSSETVIYDYQDYPRFSVTFSPRPINNLKVVFDERLGQWATDFDVRVWKGDSLDTTESVTGNTSYRWIKPVDTILQATKVEVVVKSWNKPIAKARIIESFTSIQEKYDSDDIIEISVYEESEPTDSTIPIGNVTANTCTIKLINQNNHFDNDNEDSILAGNVIKNRRIKPFTTLAGQQIPLGVFYSQKWKINNAEQEAEVSGQDLIALMEDQEYASNQFITPGSDQDFTYTTTADFNGFSRNNVIVGTDELIMDDSAVYCDDSTFSGNLFGFTLFSGSTVSSGLTYCGTAEQTISYTYTPGTSVTLKLSKGDTKPIGTNVRYFVSYTADPNFVEVNGDYTFTPENISETTQTVDIKALFTTQDLSKLPSVQDITVTLTEQVTLYSLAAKLLDDFNNVTDLIEGNFEIDQQYGEIVIPNAYFEPQKYREILRTITEAAAGRAYVGREGQFVFESIKPVATSMKDYTSDNYFEKIQPVNPNELYNRITVVTKPLKKATSDETIAEPQIDIKDGDTDSITIFFDESPSEDVSFSELPTDVTIDSQTVYTWGADLTITNSSGSDQSFTLTVSGKPYRVTGSRRVTLDDSESIRKNGVIEYIIDDNPLIQTVSQAEGITEIMLDSFSTIRRTVELDALPDPSLEVADSFTADGSFYKINKNEFDYKQGEITHIIGGKN